MMKRNRCPRKWIAAVAMLFVTVWAATGCDPAKTKQNGSAKSSSDNGSKTSDDYVTIFESHDTTQTTVRASED